MPRKQPKRQKVTSGGSSVRAGDRLFAALTYEEITQLLDVCFTVMPPDLQVRVLQQLQPDTRQTVEQVLDPSQADGGGQSPGGAPVSIAKLAQVWSTAWQEWHRIVDAAAQEEGPYMAQEAHWEPPYFDTTIFVEDLETVAATMRPLVRTAFEEAWSPYSGFAEALQEAEEDIAAAMPDWIEIHDGFYLEEHLTICLLTWEWLMAMDDDQDAFGFAQRIRQWENQFKYVSLQADALVEFFTELSEADQQLVFNGLSAHQETPLWRQSLDNTYDAWHTLYIYFIEQYAPERYLHTLRPTISQQWQNGLPIIEDLLAKHDYSESLAVIEETLAAFLRFTSRDASWDPETSLLFPRVGGGHHGDRYLDSHKTLLGYYRDTAQGLGQTERANALELQLNAFNHCYDWQMMFDAFAAAKLPKKIRQALIQSWRDHIVQQAEPHMWEWGRAKGNDTWWLHWLIESILDTRKGPTWFQNRLAAWLGSLSGKQAASTADFAFLRLLSKDVTEMNGIKHHPYPTFYQAVVSPEYLTASDDTSRQAYLKQYAADDVWDQVMAYWQTHLHDWMPGPETAQQSDYTHHAEWMAALHEVAPSAYETLLAQWRVDHHRRRNLWKAMTEAGLG